MKPNIHSVSIRDLTYHVRTWGDADKRPLFLLHGWLDMSASFQFAAEKLCADWHVIAPDWRGYGRTGKSPSYWIPDYVADLDALLQNFSPDAPAVLVGHSMGGNISTMYTAIQPQRVAALVSIEGFGMGIESPDQALSKLQKWVRGVQAKRTSADSITPAAVVSALRQYNPGLPVERAAILSEQFLEKDETGYRHLNDPLHRLPYPMPFREDEWLSFLRSIEVPTLWVEGSASPLLQLLGITAEQLRQRREAIPHLEHRVIPGCGHGIHVEKPDELAALVSSFLSCHVTQPA